MRLPSWSPDGKSIAYISNSTKGVKSIVSDLQGNSREVAQNLPNVSFLDWRNNGYLVWMSTYLLSIDEPIGSFVFKDVALKPGENTFTATATDESGNTSQPSESITVIYDTALLPDMTVVNSDITLFPAAPRPGEEVAAQAVIRNLKNIAVNNVPVDIYHWDSTGNLVQISSDIIPTLAAKAEETLAVRFNAGSQPGSSSIIVVVDPQDSIKEVIESNNSASRDFYVASSEGISMSVSVESPELAVEQDQVVDVTLRNSGLTTTGTLEVSIEDTGGIPVAKLAPVEVSINYGEILQNKFIWNSGKLFAGQYQAHTVFRSGTNITAEQTIPFVIIPELNVEATATTDKAAYGPNDSVTIVDTLKNNGRNAILKDVVVRTVITAPDNTVQLTDQKTLSSMLPGAINQPSTTWNTGMSSPGVYKATVEAVYGSKTIASGLTSFTIRGIPNVSGTISVDPATVLKGNSFKASYTISNNGNASAVGTAKILIVDLDTSTTVAEEDRTVNMTVGNTISGSVNFSSSGLSLKSYSLVLRYEDNQGGKQISNTQLTVKDGTPPILTVLSPTQGAVYNGIVSLAATASDSYSGIDRVECRIDAGTWRPMPLIDPGTGKYSISWDSALAGNGTHQAEFRTTDRAGNSTSSAVTFIVQAEVDTIPPILLVSTLADGSYTNNNILNIAGTATDNTGVQSVTVNGTGVAVNSDGSFSYALLLINGINTVITTATDLAGNKTTDTRMITLDQTAPLLTITSPADNSKTGTALLTVTGNVDETSTVVVKLGSNVQTAAMNGNIFTAMVNLVPGSNTIEVSATDLVGNTSSLKRTVLYDDQKPSVAITDPNQDIRTNHSTYTIKGTASDPYGLAVNVGISVDGQTFTPELVNAMFEQAVIFSTEKSYPIVVTATNEVGSSTSVQRNIIYDITKPGLTINPVTSPTSLNSQVITGTREDGIAVAVTCPTATMGEITYPTATTWQVNITGLKDGDNPITATAGDVAGNLATATATIKLVITPQETTFNYAIFADKNITMSGGSFTDSYSGAAAGYIQGQYKNGNVGTNSSAVCSIKLSGGTQVFGKALVGYGGNPATVLCTNGGSSVYNAVDALTSVKDMTPKTDPGGGTVMGALKASGGALKTLTSGNYRYSSIDLSGKVKLNLNGKITLHIDGNMKISGGASIVIAAGSEVTVYQNGQKMDISGGSLVNNTKDPKKLVIYGTAGMQSANFSGGTTLHAVIFAPTADISISGGQNTYGSIIGNKVDVSGGSSVHFNECLLN